MTVQTFLGQALAILMLAVFLSVGAGTVVPDEAKAVSAKCLPGVLKARLTQIRKKFGKVRIISAYRPGARIRGTGKPSFHASCRAVDFHPPRGKYAAVAKWLKANHAGGVGTYSCKMNHIHIDNGPKVRFHHCIR